jgi:uncharacterized protein (TIGR02596 family)
MVPQLTQPHRPTTRRRTAFSLVELLVVMAIIGLLLTLSVPSFIRIARSSNVTAGGKMIVDQFNLARQTAASRNRPIEVRFYFLPPSEEGPGGVPSQWRAIQLFVQEESGARPLAPVRFLPNTIIIAGDVDGDQDKSPLLNAITTNTIARLELPGYRDNGSIKIKSFRFRPTGELDGLSSIGKVNPFITVYPLFDKPNAKIGIPNNFFTVQVDPLTGRIRTHRP